MKDIKQKAMNASLSSSSDHLLQAKVVLGKELFAKIDS